MSEKAITVPEPPLVTAVIYGAVRPVVFHENLTVGNAVVALLEFRRDAGRLALTRQDAEVSKG